MKAIESILEFIGTAPGVAIVLLAAMPIYVYIIGEYITEYIERKKRKS